MKGFETICGITDDKGPSLGKKECPAMKGFETRYVVSIFYLLVNRRRNAPL